MRRYEWIYEYASFIELMWGLFISSSYYDENVL